MWLSLLQVRPDYAGPLDIRERIRLDVDAADLPRFAAMGRAHDPDRGWTPDTYFDTYNFNIDRAAGFPRGHSADWREIAFHVTLRPSNGAVTEHLPLFYLMVRVRGVRSGVLTEFGYTTRSQRSLDIADQRALPDAFQYAVHFQPP